MTPLRIDGVTDLVVVGAHCDDIAIGAGGTLLRLAPQRVRALVLTGGGTPREKEERAALAAFLPGAELEVKVLDLPDGRLPGHWGTVKQALNDLAVRTADVVLGPQRHDAHQDHRLVAELLPTAFRDHLVLGYEILKWEADLPATTVYQPLDDGHAAEKVRLLLEHYPSQAHHDWFDGETFEALMRVRGVQCHTRWAEAFVAEKLVLEP